MESSRREARLPDGRILVESGPKLNEKPYAATATSQASGAALPLGLAAARRTPFAVPPELALPGARS
jgi:hypothetical protein